MTCNMEVAAADDLEAYLRAMALGAGDASRKAACPEARIGRMAEVIFDLATNGDGTVTDADLRRAGFDDAEIAALFPRALAQARAALDILAARGIRRARVPAGRTT